MIDLRSHTWSTLSRFLTRKHKVIRTWQRTFPAPPPLPRTTWAVIFAFPGRISFEISPVSYSCDGASSIVHEAAFDDTSFKLALETGAECTASCNFGWLDWRYTTSPGVPMLKKTVKEYSRILYEVTDWAPIKLYVAIDSAKASPMTAKGALQAVSPQEQIVAVYWALAEAVVKGMTADDVEKWKKHLLTAVFTFKVLASDEDKDFETIAIRQLAAHTFAAITYTPVQWVCKIVQLKESRESNPSIGKQTSADIAKLFKKHEFKAAAGQEMISETFIENALYIWSRALCYTEVQTVLIKGAERYGHFSMFDSLSKIANIIRKCKMEPVKLKWVFSLMLDRVCEGHVCVGDFSNTNLFGAKDKKGHLDVLLSLLELKEYLLTDFVPSLNLDPSIGQMLICNYDSISPYRKKVPELNENGSRDPSDL